MPSMISGVNTCMQSPIIVWAMRCTRPMFTAGSQGAELPLTGRLARPERRGGRNAAGERRVAAGGGRAFGAGADPGIGRRASGDHDLRPRHDRNRRQGGPPRGAGLRREAPLAREDPPRGQERAAEGAARDRGPGLKQQLDERYVMVGDSPALRRLREEIAQAAPTSDAS